MLTLFCLVVAGFAGLTALLLVRVASALRTVDVFRLVAGATFAAVFVLLVPVLTLALSLLAVLTELFCDLVTNSYRLVVFSFLLLNDLSGYCTA